MSSGPRGFFKSVRLYIGCPSRKKEASYRKIFLLVKQKRNETQPMGTGTFIGGTFIIRGNRCHLHGDLREIVIAS